MSDFAPWRAVDQLPDRAPIRRVRPDALLKPDLVRPRLEAAGIDPDNAGAILSAMLRRDWPAWLVAVPGKPPRCTASVLEARMGAVWAQGRGATPAEALRAVYVLCVDEPPWERRPEDKVLPETAEPEAT